MRLACKSGGEVGLSPTRLEAKHLFRPAPLDNLLGSSPRMKFSLSDRHSGRTGGRSMGRRALWVKGFRIQTLVMATAACLLSGARVEGSVLPEVHPPIGVFGSTIHTRGDVMLSYRFNRQDYEGLMDGTHDISNAEVPARYDVIPTALRISTHYFEAMWAPVEEFTIVVSLPFYEKSLDWQERGIPESATTTTVKGFGDISLNFLYRVFDDEGGRLHINLGLGFPTGSTEESAITPTSGDKLERLPLCAAIGVGNHRYQAGRHLQRLLARHELGSSDPRGPACRNEFPGLHKGKRVRGDRLGRPQMDALVRDGFPLGLASNLQSRGLRQADVGHRLAAGRPEAAGFSPAGRTLWF